MKRDPSRPKASDITDMEILVACEQYTTVGAPFPSEPFLTRFPGKVISSKLAKAHRRGWTNEKHHLTKDGRAALAEMENAE